MAELQDVIEQIILENFSEPEEAEQDGTRIKNRSLDQLLRARALLNSSKIAANPLNAIKVRKIRGNSAL